MNYKILVNKDNLLPENYVPEDMVEIHEPTGDKIDKNYVNRLDKEAYEHFKLMQKDALKKGYEIFIDSSFRTYEYQKIIFDKIVAEKGLDYAKYYVAPPGGSEHQTGLAIDIIIRRNGEFVDEKEDDPEILWLNNNSYKYGYILRYPKDKEDITKISFEPWHYR